MEIDANMLTSVIALLLSIGGAGVLTMRGKAVTAVKRIVKILVGFANLLVAVTDAIADDSITPAELTAIKEQAISVQTEILNLKTDLGL